MVSLEIVEVQPVEKCVVVKLYTTSVAFKTTNTPYLDK